MERNNEKAAGSSGGCGQAEDAPALSEIVGQRKASDKLRMTQFCLDYAADAIYWMGPDARFTYVNETACRSLGYSREELLSMTVHDIDPNFPKEVWAEHWEQLRREGSFTIESCHRAKDGRIFPVEITVNHLKYGAKEYNCAFARDVTERRRAEELIKVSEQRYRTLAENIGLGIAHVDVDHNIIIVNSAVGQMFHSNPADFVGKKCYDVFEKAKGICSHCPGDEAIRTGRPAETEGEGVRDDGSRFPVRIQAFPLFDEDGQPTGFIEVAEDITERKRSEEEIEKFFNMAGYMICIATLDGYFTRINQSFEKTLGYRSEELLSRPYLDFVHPDDRDKTIAAVEEKLAKGARVVGFENRYRCRDGSYKWLSWVSQPVVERGITYAIAYDITDRKLAEQARNELIRELEAKHKELQSVLYAASHDLKSPLVNIQGFGHELLQSCDLIRSALTSEKKYENIEKAVDMALNRDIPESLDFILTSTRKMDSLLSGLLDVCRLNTAEVRIGPIDMNKMMADVAASIEYQITSTGAAVETEHLPPCLGDPSQINRVFTNLLNNALKFLSPSRPARIRIHAGSKANQSIYCVEDNGIGIAPEHLEKIFEIFYQLDPESRRGEGIGLAIVRRIIERHNGKVWAESSLGKGSRFFVALPST